jgi:hypothetical protein
MQYSLMNRARRGLAIWTARPKMLHTSLLQSEWMRDSTQKSGRANKRWSRALLAVAASLCASFGAPAAALAAESPADAQGAPVSSVWKAQEIGFHYQSFTTFYSCQALESRVERILLAVGADKESLQVRSTGCEGGRIARLPYVRIKLRSPVEATPEVLAELESTRSTRELAARVKGERAPDPNERIDAHWKPVALFHGRLRLDPGDCQLVEQLQREVFPKMAIRITKDQVNCMPNQVSMTMPRLDLEALIAVDQKKNGKNAPEQNESNAER